APIEFDNLRPDASSKLAAFSSPRLFTALGSPITEILFFVPGTAQAATTKGFGSVFTDVDRDDSTKIEYFDVNGKLLFSGFVPPAKGNETFSFLGVGFDAGEEAFLVRITSGDVELGGDNRGGRDLVVMDDFIYGEPQPLPWGTYGPTGQCADAATAMRQRIRSKLEVHDERARQGLARRAGARRIHALDVHRRSVA